MAFVVPGVCRFTVNGSYEGRAIANVLDIRIDTTGTISERNSCIVDQAEIIIDQWTAHLMDNISNQYEAQSVSWVDLDEADGSVGEISGGGVTTWPDSGNNVGGAMPANVALMVTKQAPAQRGRRNGRIFFVGLPESATEVATPNEINGATVAAWNSSLADFKGDVEQDGTGIGLDYTSFLVVVTVLTRGPAVPPSTHEPPLTGESRDVVSLVANSLLATQKRRLRG